MLVKFMFSQKSKKSLLSKNEKVKGPNLKYYFWDTAFFYVKILQFCILDIT